MVRPARKRQSWRALVTAGGDAWALRFRYLSTVRMNFRDWDSDLRIEKRPYCWTLPWLCGKTVLQYFGSGVVLQMVEDFDRLCEATRSDWRKHNSVMRKSKGDSIVTGLFSFIFMWIKSLGLVVYIECVDWWWTGMRWVHFFIYYHKVYCSCFHINLMAYPMYMYSIILN